MTGQMFWKSRTCICYRNYSTMNYTWTSKYFTVAVSLQFMAYTPVSLSLATPFQNKCGRSCGQYLAAIYVYTFFARGIYNVNFGPSHAVWS